jgi:hypothetical protein
MKGLTESLAKEETDREVMNSRLKTASSPAWCGREVSKMAHVKG